MGQADCAFWRRCPSRSDRRPEEASRTRPSPSLAGNAGQRSMLEKIEQFLVHVEPLVLFDVLEEVLRAECRSCAILFACTKIELFPG